MFESYTYDYLLDEALSNAPDGIDTRQGSIYYDAVSGICIELAKLYVDLDYVLSATRLTEAGGDALDALSAQFAVTRLAATSAKYLVTFEGTVPDVGERFYYDGQYFTLGQDAGGTYYLEAEEAGEDGNTIYAGTPAIPVNTIDGLISATFGEIYENGSGEEDDESLRERIIEKIAGPAENGNRQDYKTWCESIDGVGQARIFPLWNGENTVKAVLIDTTGQPCGAAVVAQVQEYIDPADKGMTAEVDGKTYVVGDGLGNGVANIGAHFTAAAADALYVTVGFTAELASGSTLEAVQAEASEAIAEYFRELVLGGDGEESVTVRVSAVGAILSGLSGLTDYGGLTLNGGTENIEASGDDVPVLLEVTVS